MPCRRYGDEAFGVPAITRFQGNTEAELRLHVLALEEQAVERDRGTELLQSELSRLSRAQETTDAALMAALGRLSRVEARVAQMGSSAEETLKRSAEPSAPTAAQLRRLRSSSCSLMCESSGLEWGKALNHHELTEVGHRDHST
jgi:hypothetical protein